EIARRIHRLCASASLNGGVVVMPKHSAGGSLTSHTAIKTRARTEAAAVVHISGERKQREILAIHVVFQIKHARETRACNLFFIPRTIGLLRAQQVTQAALNT